MTEILLSFQTGVNLVSAAVFCAILVNISGSELASDITEPWYLKLVTVSICCPFTLSSVLKTTLLMALSTRITLALIYFFIVAHKAAQLFLLKAFLKSMETWQRSRWCWRCFSHMILRLKSAL